MPDSKHWSFTAAAMIALAIAFVTPTDALAQQADQTDAEAETANEAVATKKAKKQSPKSTPSDPAAAGNERIEKTLNSEVNVEFVGESLSTAIDYWSQLYGIPILIETRKLEEDGISPQEEFTVLVQKVPLRDVLARVLAREIGDLDYYVAGGILHVTTQTDAAENRTTKAYPLGDGVSAADAGRLLLAHLHDSPRGDITLQYGDAISAVGNTLIVTHSHRGHEAVAKILETLDDAEGKVEIIFSGEEPQQGGGLGGHVGGGSGGYF